MGVGKGNSAKVLIRRHGRKKSINCNKLCLDHY